MLRRPLSHLSNVQHLVWIDVCREHSGTVLPLGTLEVSLKTVWNDLDWGTSFCSAKTTNSVIMGLRGAEVTQIMNHSPFIYCARSDRALSPLWSAFVPVVLNLVSALLSSSTPVLCCVRFCFCYHVEVSYAFCKDAVNSPALFERNDSLASF